MKIFIIGSYLKKNIEGTKANIEKAISAGKEILKKGHLPFVPQPMFAFWEKDIDMKLIMKACFAWIKECDAVLELNLGKKGDGTWKALQHAKKFNKKIFRSLNEIL